MAQNRRQTLRKYCATAICNVSVPKRILSKTGCGDKKRSARWSVVFPNVERDFMRQLKGHTWGASGVRDVVRHRAPIMLQLGRRVAGTTEL